MDQGSPWHTGEHHESDRSGGGLYYYGARWYDAFSGRFISADTIVPDAGNPQDLNRYSYVRNNPVKYTDPSGHTPETIWDVINIGLGFASLANNVSEGNWGDAAWDAGGLVIDVAATAVPFMPGGASTLIQSKRLAAAARWASAEAEISHKLQRAIIATAAETPGMEIAVFRRAPGANALDGLYPAKPDTLEEVARLAHGKRLMSDGQIYISDLDLAVVTIDGVPVTDDLVKRRVQARINDHYGYDVVMHTDQYNGELLRNSKALDAAPRRATETVYRFTGRGYGGSATFAAYTNSHFFY